MTKEELISKLKQILDRQNGNKCTKEEDHYDADDLLLQYINDKRVTDIFEKIDKWYS